MREDVERYENFDLENIMTPVDPDVLEKLLVQSNYDRAETEFVVNGFRNRFDIQYQGEKVRQSTGGSRNWGKTILC